MSGSFDRRAVLDRFGGDTALLAHVAELFRQSAQDWLKEIQAARACGDFPQMKRVAHTLKGSVSNFLANDAAGAALRVQELAAAADAQQIDTAIAKLESEVQRLLDDLAALLSTASAR
jgi:HPt (histidine-containing phosphotransfer) domain-containing protein